MNKRHWTSAGLLAAVIASALGVGWLLRWKPAQPVQAVPVAPVAQSPATGRAASARPADKRQTAAPPAAPTEEEKSKREAEHINRRLVEIGKRAAAPLRARWEHEPQDPKWSDFEARLASFLSDPRLENIDLVSVDCRTTLCRYELLDDNREAVQKMEALAREEGENLVGIGLHVLDGEHYTMYMAPPGEPFFRERIPENLLKLARNLGVRIGQEGSP